LPNTTEGQFEQETFFIFLPGKHEGQPEGEGRKMEAGKCGSSGKFVLFVGWADMIMGHG
jgi:hypothetical protein